MKIDLTGNKIKLVNTVISDIDRIMEFERINSGFVCQYSKERHLALLREENCLHLSIKRMDNDSLVGHMILFGLMDNNRILEFRRITINEKGSGYGRESIRLLKYLCFEKLRFHRLWLDVYDDNQRAINLYDSEGFILEGVLRDNIFSGNIYRSQRIYSILEDEYIPWPDTAQHKTESE